MLTPNHIPLSRLAPELAPLIACPPPPYRTLADRVRDGRFPTEIVGGRYYVQRASLPAIAQALGLPLAPPAQAAA